MSLNSWSKIVEKSCNNDHEKEEKTLTIHKGLYPDSHRYMKFEVWEKSHFSILLRIFELYVKYFDERKDEFYHFTRYLFNHSKNNVSQYLLDLDEYPDSNDTLEYYKYKDKYRKKKDI